MKRNGWSDHGVFDGDRASSAGRGVANSRRERAAARQKRRARQHLERVRGESGARPPGPPLRTAWIAPIAAALSLLMGAAFGAPLVAAARSWIGGEPVRIASIHVSGAERLASDEIARGTGVPRGARLDAIDPAAVARRLAEHPWIAGAEVVALPTGRLLVRVTERVARAVVSAPGLDGLRVVDADGLPFAAAEQTDIAALPRLVAAGPVDVGAANEGLASGIALAERLREMGLRAPTEVRLPAPDDPEGVSIRLPIWRARIVLGRGDLEPALASLQQLADSGRSELAEAGTIDLRFAEQAVLRSAPPPPGAAQAATKRGRAESSEPRPTG